LILWIRGHRLELGAGLFHSGCLIAARNPGGRFNLDLIQAASQVTTLSPQSIIQTRSLDAGRLSIRIGAAQFGGGRASGSHRIAEQRANPVGFLDRRSLLAPCLRKLNGKGWQALLNVPRFFSEAHDGILGIKLAWG
jgi:hypothetical protein